MDHDLVLELCLQKERTDIYEYTKACKRYLFRFRISNPRVLGSHGLNLYFFTNDNSYGYELWKTDGTETGTVLVKDINPVVSDSLDSSFW